MWNRRWSLLLATAAGVVAVPVSILIRAAVGGRMVEPWDNPSPWNDPLLWVIVPPLLAMAIAWKFSERGSRQIVMASCIAGIFLGYAAVAGWLALSLQQVEFVNNTSLPLVVSYAREDDKRLYHTGPPMLRPGESYKGPGGFERRGSTLRVVAAREDGYRVFDHTYTWRQLSQAGNQVIFTSEQLSP